MASKFEFDESKQPVFYRVQGRYDGHGVDMYTIKYYGFRETPTGWWVSTMLGHQLQYRLQGVPEAQWLTHAKALTGEETFWVHKGGNKKCHPSIDGALYSYKRRKEVQLSIVQQQVSGAAMQYAAAAALTPEEVDKLKMTGGVYHADRRAWEPFVHTGPKIHLSPF